VRMQIFWAGEEVGREYRGKEDEGDGVGARVGVCGGEVLVFRKECDADEIEQGVCRGKSSVRLVIAS